MKLNRSNGHTDEEFKHYSPSNIGALMKQHFPSAVIKPGEPVAAERCRFDMFVRYNKREKRNKYTFTYRGDHFGDTDPAKMLWSLVRMFTNKYGTMFHVELYDNTKQKNDPERIILKYSAGVIIENRLNQLAPMLQNFPVAEWLKPK